jgi:protein-tyrosine phosphatase
MLFKSEQIVPFNYRTHDFHLFDQDIQIGGMARQNYNNQDTETTLGLLKHINPHCVLIGLYQKYDFTSEAAAAGLTYVFIPVADFQLTSPKIYDDIYARIKQATSDGYQVTIHCGAGNGRTGAALGDLKLRELLETAAKEDPAILDDAPDSNAETILLSEIMMNFPCSPLVKQAIEHIRVHRHTFNNNDNGIDSIESETDVISLLGYEKHLRQLIKHELQDKSASEYKSGFSC